MSGRFDELKFFGQWRPYQKAALAAFEKDRQTGKRTHIVAPPGSGKTLLGVELIRRVGKRALVLAPNQGIQQQWPRAVGEFTPQPQAIAGADPLKPIACLSYQALCQLEDPEIVLGRLAQSRWADERAAATGMTPEEAQREGEAFEGAAADRRARELSRISAALKREVARGEHAGVELRDLLSETARQRVQQLAKMGVGVVLLDECHHLASLWGYVVRAVIGELGEDVHVIGLTATPPVSLPEAEAELYDALLGPVDFTVPTPAVVRDGHLAPYQELAYITQPLPSERDWLAEHDTRFRELITTLHDDLEFPQWVRSGSPSASARADDETELLVGRVPEAQPEARPRRRALPAGAGRIPGAPARRGLPPAARPRRLARPARGLRAALPRAAVGRQGRRPVRRDRRRAARARLPAHPQGHPPRHVRGRPPADRLPGQGARARRRPRRRARVPRRRAARARPDRRRARLPAPRRRAHRRPGPRRRHRPPRPAGDRQRRPHRATSARCWSPAAACAATRNDAEVLLDALEATAEDHFKLEEWEAEVDGLLVTLQSGGAEWMPRAWVELATRAVRRGHTTCLVGTRALLGEGWNCRAAERPDRHDDRHHRRLRPADARPLPAAGPRRRQKVASNWDIVCVAPDLVRGSADYERFVRKHLNLFAPAEDGEVEAGPSHVHPELGPFGPPPVERLDELNRSCSPAPPTATPPASAGRSARPTAASSCPPCWCAAATAPGRRSRSPARRARCTSPSRSRSPPASAAGSRSACSASPPARRRCSPASRSFPPASAGPPCGCAAPSSGCR